MLADNAVLSVLYGFPNQCRDLTAEDAEDAEEQRDNRRPTHRDPSTGKSQLLTPSLRLEPSTAAAPFRRRLRSIRMRRRSRTSIRSRTLP